jgi:hypothetical protein
MKMQGYRTPFERIKQAYQYSSDIKAKEEIKDIGLEISKTGIPSEIHPLAIGLSV